jgi:hypothetical protein
MKHREKNLRTNEGKIEIHCKANYLTLYKLIY